MKTLEYRTVDKTSWGPGPWQDEPDKKQWRDATTGLPCLAVRNGHWCGYVGVPQGHPMYGKDYDRVDVDVHGGLTFASRCTEITPEAWQTMAAKVRAWRTEAARYPSGDAAGRLKDWGAALGTFETWAEQARGRFICHLPEPGEPDDVWWFGFDCAHYGDLSPSYDSKYRGHDELAVYRDLGYVERECANLAAQLAALAPSEAVAGGAPPEGREGARD